MSYPDPHAPEQPKPKRSKKGIGCGIAVLLVLIIGIASAANSSHTTSVPPTVIASSSDSPMPVDATTPPVATTKAAQPSKAPAPPKPKVLMKAKGTGIKNTPEFTTGNDWTVSYTFDCAGQMMGGSGNFIVMDETDMPLVNELKVKGSGSSPQYGNSGTHHLQVNSECDWTVTVTG